MPNLLSIPTGIRLKILDYAIADLELDGWLVRRADTNSKNDWNHFKNPNVNVHLIRRQIRSECNSPQVRKPILQKREPRGDTGHWSSYFLQLKGESGLYTSQQAQLSAMNKMVAQISMLRTVETIIAGVTPAVDSNTRERRQQKLEGYMRDDVRGFFPLNDHELEVEVELSEHGDSALVTTTIAFP